MPGRAPDTADINQHSPRQESSDYVNKQLLTTTLRQSWRPARPLRVVALALSSDTNRLRRDPWDGGESVQRSPRKKGAELTVLVLVDALAGTFGRMGMRNSERPALRSE